jgi:hypothetical protein
MALLPRGIELAASEGVVMSTMSKASVVSGSRSDGVGRRDGDQRPTSCRLSLNKPEAAACLGMSIDSFERYVQPELRVIRRGRLRLFPLAELERWIAENAERPIERWECVEEPARH